MIKTEKNIRLSYKLYKKEFKNGIDIKKYINLCNGYNKFIIQNVIKGNEVVLPHKLGTFSIQGNITEIKYDEEGKPNLAPNWAKTKKLWDRCLECKEKKQVVYNTNEHTNGVRYKLIWSKKKVLVKNKILYSFRLTRENKREINKSIMEGKEYFIHK